MDILPGFMFVSTEHCVISLVWLQSEMSHFQLHVYRFCMTLGHGFIRGYSVRNNAGGCWEKPIMSVQMLAMSHVVCTHNREMITLEKSQTTPHSSWHRGFIILWTMKYSWFMGHMKIVKFLFVYCKLIIVITNFRAFILFYFLHCDRDLFCLIYSSHCALINRPLHSTDYELRFSYPVYIYLKKK